MATAQLMDTDMSMWAPGTRHYQTDDGHNFAVQVNAELTDAAKVYVNQVLEELGAPPIDVPTPFRNRVTPQPTVIIECNADGGSIDLTPLHHFPPGTSHEYALVAAGYTLA